MSAEPFKNTDFSGVLRYAPTITSNASGASPQATTFTLPRQGIWLVTGVAKVNGSVDHQMMTVNLINWYDATNDTLLSTAIGAVAKSTGSGFSLTTVTISNPTAAGVCTITASWADGANHTVAWQVTARQLQAP